MNSIEAKKFLSDQGYYSDNMWKVEDVMIFYKCTESEAYDMLDKAMTSDYILSQIWDSIDLVAKKLNIEER